MTEPKTVVIVSRVKIKELSMSVNTMESKAVTEFLNHLDFDVLEKASTVFNDRKKPPGVTGKKN